MTACEAIAKVVAGEFIIVTSRAAATGIQDGLDLRPDAGATYR